MAAPPEVLTNRTTFEQKIGAYTTLTLDTPVVSQDPSTSSYSATYGNLITFTCDLQGGVGVNKNGTVTLGTTNLIARGEVLQPVTAFGFDIVMADSRGEAHLMVDGKDYSVPLNNVSFLGVIYPTPVPMSVQYLPKSSGAGEMIGGFTLKNVIIQIPLHQMAPSPPTNLKIG